jgi:uncharacterized membrane protein YdjX (TVP38/TMEM64 family)
MSDFTKFKRYWKPVLTLIGFIGLLVLLNFLPLEEWLKPLFTQLKDFGIWGGVLFVVLGVLLAVLFVPVSVLMTLAGYIFDPALGFVFASLILIGGTSIGFVGGRYLWPHIKHFEMFQASIFQSIRMAVEQEGNRLIAFLRMTPFFHFMTGNLFFGSLELRFLPYLAFSYLGMVPGTFLLVFAGSVTNSGSTDSEGVQMGQWILFGLGILVFTGVSWRITQATRKILRSSDINKSTPSVG